MRRVQTKASAGDGRSQKPQNSAPFADGQVTWITIDGVCLPCIIRGGKPHGPVRIIEDKLLNRLSSTDAVNAAFQSCRLLVSKYLTNLEALRMTYHAGETFGVFSCKDLVVDIDEFRALYMRIVQVLCLKNTTVTGGWVQVNNRYVVYVYTE